MNETEYDKVAYDNELWKDQNNKTAFTNHKKKNQLEIPDNRSPDSFESSRQNARKTLIPAQRVDINLDPDYVSLSNNGNLPDKSSVYLVISDYITAYKNRDIRKLEGLFSSNARENGKSIEEVIKTYKDNFERINVLAYDIKFDNVNFVKDRADVYGDFIITFRTNEDKINQQSRGNIYWNLSWDQDNWIIDEINYEVSRTSKEHAIESAF